VSAAAVTGSGDTGVWPELTLAGWEDTRDTLHLWTQVVGKVRLALEPMVNHWWQVPFYVSARGLTTSLMHADGRGVEIEFDFLDHAVHVVTTDGQHRRVALEPRSVASFYREVMATLDGVGVHVAVLARPVETARAVPFALDDEHCSYDPAAARRFWAALVQADRYRRRPRRDAPGVLAEHLRGGRRARGPAGPSAPSSPRTGPPAARQAWQPLRRAPSPPRRRRW